MNLGKLKENLLLYSRLFAAGVFIYFAFLLAENVLPIYLWLLLPGAIFGLLAYLEYRRLERQKLLTRLRKEWGGRQLDKKRPFDEISALFEQAPRSSTIIDDRTWEDLTMDIIFTQIDRTITWPGMQRLYQILRSPLITKLNELKERGNIISHFQENKKGREQVQVILSGMDARIGSGLATLLWDTPRLKPIHPLFIYYIMFVVAALSPLLFLLGPSYALAILFIFQINMYLHFKVQKQIKAHFEGVRSLRQLVKVSQKLVDLDAEVLSDLLMEIRQSLEVVGRFNRLVRFVGVESTDALTHMSLQYFNIFFLAEVRGFYQALSFIKENRSALQNLFLAVGELDSLQSVASYRTSLDYYCEPNFSEERLLRFEDAYHPLLKNPVPNSIDIREQGILITGSNMSGKSTFLRTVGLNALLGQTIYTCTAKSYSGCPAQLLTSIGRTDNVVEGKSYYLEEALSVLRIIEAITSEITTLVIFDELYRGTNSEERIFAARRVLEYLARRNAFVLVATHDLELTNLLAEHYLSLHFSERVGQLGLEFDYKLKKGPATTRNAIALLRYLGYPEEITDQS